MNATETDCIVNVNNIYKNFGALHLGEPKNLEEQGLKLVGKYVFEKLIKGYTGMIDQFYGYRFGELEYHSLRFET